MKRTNELVGKLRRAINRERLVETAVRFLSVPSPTGDGGKASDCLAQILTEDGFRVERPEAGHPSAPAVVVRFDSGKAGQVLQFNGHLDTVHLPFVPPQVSGDRITGSGASDMKAGLIAAVEALRALRDTQALSSGSILLTAHDLHEAPWGFGQQLDRLIQDGCVGNAVLIPEPLCHPLPVVGRGAATWRATIRRDGAPVHEVMRPGDQPSVIAAGAELVRRLEQLNSRLAAQSDPMAGSASVFIGQIHSGEIYNQYPQECWMEGTRRWLPGTARQSVETEFRDLLSGLEKEKGVTITADFRFIRDAFFLDQQHPFVQAFQECYQEISDKPLPIGPKPFVDDGNSFWGLAQIPAITHGPRAGGQHTVNEWVSIDDLVRVAQLYALTAVAFCGEEII